MPAALPTPLYTTEGGQAYVGDSLDLLPRLPADSVDLIITSPPFGLQRQKEYGNATEDAHVDWLLQFAEPVKRVLDLGGAIPANLLQIPNTESNSPYQRHCTTVGVKPHPPRFSEKLPTFFIEFLTDLGDTVLDIFACSNTTGRAAEKLDRRWMAFEKERTYLATSAFRFVDELPAEDLATLWSRLHSGDLSGEVNRQQREMVLIEKVAPYASKAKGKMKP